MSTYYGSGVDDLNPTPEVTTVPAPTFNKDKVKNGAIYFFGGIMISCLIFVIVYWLLSGFDLHYILRSILSLIFSILIIKAWDKVTGEEETLFSAPISYTVAVMFILSLLFGYQHNKSVDAADNDSKTAKTEIVVPRLSSETFSFTGPQRWATNVTFKAGQKYRVIVQGSSVNLISGSGETTELNSAQSPYEFTVDAAGSPTFDGLEYTNGARSNVTVEWE